MNLLKNNKLGVNPKLESVFNEMKSILLEHKNLSSDSINMLAFHSDMLKFKCQKTIRISDSIFKLSQSINIDSINNNIDSLDMKFTDIKILLPNDNDGVIFIKRVCQDILFFHISDLKDKYENIDKSFLQNISINVYSFLTKSFQFEYEENQNFHENKAFSVLKILTYLFYGEVEQKLISPKQKIMKGKFQYLKNETKNNIWYADSLWKTKLSLVGDFKVSGHFRLQPCGENRSNKRLIFIEEFVKHGYSRNATIDKFNKQAVQ